MLMMTHDPAQDLRRDLAGRRFATVLADPPWRFVNRTGKVAPEHRRLSRYPTLTVEEICALPVGEHVAGTAHCYLWVPNCAGRSTWRGCGRGSGRRGSICAGSIRRPSPGRRRGW